MRHGGNPVTDLGMPALLELPELADCGRLCRELGLQFIELNMNLPRYQPGRISPALLREIAGEYGVYYTIHLDENLNVSDWNPYVADAYVRTVIETIQLAAALQIPILNMHLPRGVYFTLPDKKVFLFDRFRGAYLAGLAAFREKCGAAVSGADVRICIENTDGFLDFQAEAIDLLLQSPVFGLTWDIGHSHSAGYRDEAFLLRRRERLLHFHVHDGKGPKNHLPLGAGEIDIEKYLALAGSLGCRIVLETKTAEGLRQSVRQLRRRRAPGERRPGG